MTLTLDSGPLSAHPPYTVNYTVDGPEHLLLAQPFPRRVRGVVGDVTVLDTRRGLLVHETNLPPQLYVPDGDIADRYLTPTEHSTHCPYKGDARYWTLRVGDTVAENAVWAYPEPNPRATWLRGHKSFYWGRIDQWWDEAERVYGGLRDPYHRTDTRATDSTVRVRRGDTLLAESTDAIVLSETGLPNRYYLPADSVRVRLVDSATRAVCPYKGFSRYRSLDDGTADVAWTYPEPFDSVAPIAGRLSFDHESITVEVDGEPV